MTRVHPSGKGLPQDYAERVYAGVQGKIIGVYLGRPFETWTYQRIINELGHIRYYVHDKLQVPLVVTDDDITGPFTFIRALQEHGVTADISSEQIGKTWLNNVIQEKSVFWWGGKGISTEHTAFLNLRAGIPAPESGSINRNGKTVAEQVGAQIFIDGWAMVSPGNPTQAARFATSAASVSHDGEAVYAARVWAAMEAEAFVSVDIDHLLDTGLAVVPSNCQIARLIRDVRQWAKEDCDWEKTRQRIEDCYGYEKYHGVCHVIPNHGLMIMALLYGGHSFREAMHIIMTSGWDTDSNGGNIGCLVAIMHGLAAFEEGLDWRGPLADRALISSADGGYSINNAARIALDLVDIGRQLRGLGPLPPSKDGAQFHFEFPGSVQGFRAHPSIATTVQQAIDPRGIPGLAVRLTNLKPYMEPVEILTDTHHPADIPIHGQLYPLSATPLLYPGQRVRASIFPDHNVSPEIRCCLVVKTYDRDDHLFSLLGPSATLIPGQKADLEWTLPESEDSQPFQALGIRLSSASVATGTVWLDRLGWTGTPRMTLRLPRGAPDRPFEFWRRAWVGNVDKLHMWNGSSFLVANSSGEGLLSIGTREWTNYVVTAKAFIINMGSQTGVAVRVQGLNRWYALLLTGGGKHISIIKAHDEKRVELACVDFPWELDVAYNISISVNDAKIRGSVNGTTIETRCPGGSYLSGGIGLLVTDGSFSVEQINIEPV